MKQILIALALASLAAPDFGELLKHGTDTDAGEIVACKDTSLKQIARWPRPLGLHDDGQRGSNHRFAPMETTIWSVTGVVTDIQVRDDGDLRMVLTDGRGHEVVAECPDPKDCASSAFRKKIESARQSAFSLMKPSPDSSKPNLKVTIHAIGCFGKLPKDAVETKANGFRLMPILFIESAD